MNTNEKKITAAIYICSLIILAIIFFVGKTYHIPYEKLTGDPAFNSNSNPFIGVLSNFGALLWCATASICFFSGFKLYKTDKKNYGQFLLSSGLFTTILLVDDFFMIHDYVIYIIIPFHFAQSIIFLFYGLFALWYVIKNTKIILSLKYISLALSFLFLGLSMGIDLAYENISLEYFIENSSLVSSFTTLLM